MSNLIAIPQTDTRYPSSLRLHLGSDAPTTLTARGDLNILSDHRHRPLFALFCSIQCPPALILQTYELAHALRDASVTVISGFHSPMEKECLAILLGGTQPVILCPARSLEGISISTEKKTALEQGRLLFLTPFTAKERRPTTNRAQERNASLPHWLTSSSLLMLHLAGKPRSFARTYSPGKNQCLHLIVTRTHICFRWASTSCRPEQIGKQGELFVVDEEE